MAWEVILWLVSFFISMALIALAFYQLICLSDLEFDYINPYDSSSRINAVVIPEFVIQGAVCVLFLITWHWFMFLIMAPVTYFHIRLYLQRKHLIDVTEIFRLLNDEKKIRLVKLVFYLTLLFITIYSLLGFWVALYYCMGWIQLLVASAVTSLVDEDDALLGSGI